MLRRLGFAVLMIGLPLAALFARRGIVLLFPIGAALLVIAAALDGSARNLRTSLEQLATSTGVAAAAFAFGWAALSITWAPLPAVSAERLLAIGGNLLVGLAAYLALPERMRAANLYLLPIGAGATALVVLAMSWTGLATRLEVDEDGRSLERGLSLLVLVLWPAIAWLRSRDRDREAVAVVVAVCAATLFAPQSFASVALSVGALAYVATTLAGRHAALAVGVVMAAIILVAPIIPALLLTVLGRPAVPPGSWLEAVSAWGVTVGSDPLRLLTGQGFGTLLRARLAGLVPAATPDVPLVQIWYDLGAVGAVSIAAALVGGAAGAARSYAPLLPGVTAAFASAFAMSCIGIGSTQAWWPAALAVVGLLFVAEERGQFRTRRPRAALAVPPR